MSKNFAVCATLALVLFCSRTAAAYAGREVGLGVAAGVAYSPTTTRPSIANVQNSIHAGQSFAWGFFVDIPILETFYISPAAMLYEYNLGLGKVPITDVDVNFKFIVPVGIVRLGAGLTFGLTAASNQYGVHFGGLGYLGVNVVSNVDVFAMVQYKKLVRDPGPNIDDIHGFVGGMFHF